MNKTISLRKRIQFPITISSKITETSKDGIIEEWEWNELKNLCLTENVSIDRVRRELELNGVSFNLPIEGNLKIHGELFELSINANLFIKRLSIFFLHSPKITIHEAHVLSDLRPQQPIPTIQIPIDNKIEESIVNIVFKVDIDETTIWLNTQPSLHVYNTEQGPVFTHGKDATLKLTVINNDNAQQILNRHNNLPSPANINVAYPSPKLEQNELAHVESDGINQTNADATPPPIKSAHNKAPLIGLLMVGVLLYFGASFWIAQKIEDAAFNVLLTHDDQATFDTLSQYVEQSSFLFSTNTTKDFKQLQRIIHMRNTGISNSDIIDSTHTTVSSNPLGQYTLAHAYNFGCQDGRLDHCGEAKDILQRLMSENLGKLSTPVFIQYANTLGFSSRVSNSSIVYDPLVTAFCDSVDSSIITVDNAMAILRCNGYKSDILNTYDTGQWQHSVKQQIQTMRANNLDEEYIMSFLWQSGSLQCLNTPLKQNDDVYIPKYSWKRSPEVGYCYFVGLIILDCPIKATQVREYGQIFSPEKIWMSHFNEVKASISNRCQIKRRMREVEELDLFSYSINNILFQKKDSYDLTINPDGTWAGRVYCDYPYRRKELKGFWSWDDYKETKGVLSLHVITRDGENIYHFDKDSSYKANVYLSSRKYLSIPLRTMKKFRKLGC